jgi:hypothetical protein
VVTVASDSDLAGAAGSATAGTCIALKPGTYGDVTLPPGVSLLGRGAGDVHLDGVVVGNGTGAVVRGLSIGAGGLQIADGAHGVQIDSVQVDSTTANGIDVGQGGQVSIVRTTISNAGAGSPTGANGIAAVKGGDVTLDHTFIDSASGPGLWMQACSDGCSCPGGSTLSAHAVVVQGCELVGASLAGTTATLGDVTITQTDTYHYTQGGGLSISQCSTVTSDGDVTVSDNKLYGVLIDHSSATMGDMGGSSVSVNGNNVYGIWIQGVGQTPSGGAQSVTLTNLQANDNTGVAIGLDGSSTAIIIQGKSAALRTKAATLPSLTNGTTPTVQSVGDGLSWNAGVEARIDGLTLHGNARTDMLVTGQWADGSSATNLGVSDGDQNCIIIQGRTGGSLMPGMDTLPQNLISQSASFQFAVAAAPQSPAAIAP